MKKLLFGLIATIIVLFIGCEKEGFEKSKEMKNFVVKNYSFGNKLNRKEFGITNFIIAEGIDIVRSYSSKNRGGNQNFIIDTTSIKEINYGNYTSYTMSIKREIQNDSIFENIVIEIDSLNNRVAYLIKYIPRQKLEHTMEHDSYNFDGQSICTKYQYPTSIIPVMNENTGLFTEYDQASGSPSTTSCVLVLKCNYGGHVHNAGENCTSANVYPVLECTSAQNSSGSIPYNENGSVHFGGGNGSNNNTSQSNPQTSNAPITTIVIPPKVDLTDPSIENSKLKCLHKKMISAKKGNSESFFYAKIIQFISESNINVKFKTALILPSANNISAPDAVTYGTNEGNYTIVFNSLYSENGSNLQGMISLTHELIHVLMFNDLKKWGLITFDQEGYPLFDQTANCSGITNIGVDFPDLSLKERYVRLICVYMLAASLNTNTMTPGDWTHSLFNTINFDTFSFREKIKNFVLAKHDFDAEPDAVKSELINTFGLSNWKQTTSEYLSWYGLQNTPEFAQWLDVKNINQNEWEVTIDPFVGLLSTANNVCN